MKNGFSASLLILAMSAGALHPALAAPASANYDEARVGAYTLPDPLRFADGSEVRTAAQWSMERRPEILEIFRSEVFGRTPKNLPGPTFQLLESNSQALEGIATRKQVRIWLLGTHGGPHLDLLLYIPNNTRRAPVFTGLNFAGNHTVIHDPAVHPPASWVADRYRKGKTADDARGMQSSRWPIAKIVSRGYAVATAYYGDIEPDFAEGWKQSVRGALAKEGTTFRPEDWGAIGAWAWGLSRIVDYLETDPRIDAKRIAVVGHSRLGKTALWAGAQDQRFKIVISNNSGEGGASLARRNFGETTQRINTSFPHWFCGNYKKYNGNEGALPVDAHMLIALSAPRCVYVASSKEDLWADPKGEFLALRHAEPVYRLLGKKGVPPEMPPPNHSVGGCLGYHIRTGAHNITSFDWDQYLDFAERNF